MAVQTIEIEVQGMTCQHCAGKVQAALAGVAGVESATVDLAQGQAEVGLKNTVHVGILLEAVKQAGFTPAGFKKR